MSREMGPSSIKGDMIRMPLPNGFVQYPAKFAEDALWNNKYSVFITTGVTNTDPDILMATLNTGARTIMMGPFGQLLTELKSLDWPEDPIQTSIGRCYRKIAPSLSVLQKFIEEMKSKYNAE